MTKEQNYLIGSSHEIW